MPDTPQINPIAWEDLGKARRELLDGKPVPGMPVGWEGLYLRAVDSLAEFVAWIDLELGWASAFYDRRGHLPSSGRHVRNAHRLVAKLPVRGVSLEPKGPFTLDDEMAELRNIRRRLVEMIDGEKGGNKQLNRGRKPPSDQETQRRKQLKADWEQAKEKGVSKKVFCKDCKPPITTKKLNSILARLRPKKDKTVT